MITVLKKVRRKLMTDNKFTKYLLYAIGEIVLVVIGILIALQINNANQRKLDKASLDAHLKSIAINIKSDLQKARFIKAKRQEILSKETYLRANLEQRVNTSRQFTNSIGTSYNKQDVLFVSRLMQDLRDLDYLNANTSGFESLKNYGHLTKLQGKDIGNLLSGYYNLINQLTLDENAYNQLVENAIEDFTKARLPGTEALYRPDFEDWESQIENFRPKFANILSHASMANALSLPYDLIVDYENLITMGEELTRIIDLNTTDYDEDSKKNLARVFNKFENVAYSKLLVNGHIPLYYSALEAFSETTSTSGMNKFYYQEIELNFSQMAWGVFYFYVGRGSVESLATKDFSSYKTLRIELKGENGGEEVQISIKDETNPTDGSEAKVTLTLTSEWAYYDIPLSKFKGTNLKKLFMPAAIIFERNATTVSVRNIEYLH